MSDLIKPGRALRRKPVGTPKSAKPKVKVMLLELFNGWRDLPPPALEERVQQIRWLAAGQRRLNDAEWHELDRMRDVMRANMKFKQAIGG
jgi:hypothetical protein